MDSISHKQLAGHDLPIELLQTCRPAITNAQMGKEFAIDGTPLDPDEPAFPCGVVAKSFFTDSFRIYKSNPF